MYIYTNIVYENNKNNKKKITKFNLYCLTFTTNHPRSSNATTH